MLVSSGACLAVRGVSRRALESLLVKEMAPLGLEHTIVRNRIRRWSEAVERVPPVGIGRELSSQIAINLGVVLLLIEAVRRGLPHIDGCIRDRLSGFHVPNKAVHIRDFTIIDIMDNRRLVWELWGIVPEEGT